MDETELRRRRWHCRRGMKELDILLVRWLDRLGPPASTQDQAAFDRILALPDPQLARHLLAGEPYPEPGSGLESDAAVAALLERIRSLPP